MSYKLGGIPSLRASRSEKADFLEVQCLICAEKRYSAVEAAQAVGIIDEGNYESLEHRELNDIPFFSELNCIEDRFNQSNSHYPFVTDGSSIQIDEDCDGMYKDVYMFLLFATRNDMCMNRCVGNLDGAKLFEQLCACVLKVYFGANSNCFVFGTGDDEHRSFEDKLQNLLSNLGEPKTSITRPDDDGGHQQDDKLDVVAHIPFNDKRYGQFIAFAQCKTGDSWDATISQLNPLSFAKDYFNPPLNFTPIKVYMVSKAFSEDWRRKSGEVVLFDRCRIMRYLPPSLNTELIENIRKWNKGILSSLV